MSPKIRGVKTTYIYKENNPASSLNYWLHIDGLEPFYGSVELIDTIKTLVEWIEKYNITEKIEIVFNPPPNVNKNPRYFWGPLLRSERIKIRRILNFSTR